VGVGVVESWCEKVYELVWVWLRVAGSKCRGKLGEGSARASWRIISEIARAKSRVALQA